MINFLKSNETPFSTTNFYFCLLFPIPNHYWYNFPSSAVTHASTHRVAVYILAQGPNMMIQLIVHPKKINMVHNMEVHTVHHMIIMVHVVLSDVAVLVSLIGDYFEGDIMVAFLFLCFHFKVPCAIQAMAHQNHHHRHHVIMIWVIHHLMIPKKAMRSLKLNVIVIMDHVAIMAVSRKIKQHFRIEYLSFQTNTYIHIYIYSIYK